MVDTWVGRCPNPRDTVVTRMVAGKMIALTLTFALVMVLAFDMDRAGEGRISVSQKPMIELYQSMSTQ